MSEDEKKEGYRKDAALLIDIRKVEIQEEQLFRQTIYWSLALLIAVAAVIVQAFK